MRLRGLKLCPVSIPLVFVDPFHFGRLGRVELGRCSLLGGTGVVDDDELGIAERREAARLPELAGAGSEDWRRPEAALLWTLEERVFGFGV